MEFRRAVQLIPRVFEDATGLQVEQGQVEQDRTETRGELYVLDLCIAAGDYLFAVAYKASGAAERVGGAIRHLRHYVDSVDNRCLPLVVVPYMGDVGRALCRAAEVSWLDLCGNAEIDAQSLHVRIRGNPNRFKRRGRPANLFAPKSSRVARALLLEPKRVFSQRELAAATGLGEAYISMIVPRYEEAGFVFREGSRPARIGLREPDILLDGWHRTYDFGIHETRHGHVAARSGTELLERLADMLARGDLTYAVTGLAAAWLLAPVAGFRLATLYVVEWPDVRCLKEVGFREGPRGSNVWLVLPKDDGVFTGGGTQRGLRHVSAVQAYLDLKDQPERSQEAAAELRQTCLNWGSDDG